MPLPLQAELQAETADEDLPAGGNPRENGRNTGKDGKDGRIQPLSNGDDRLEPEAIQAHLARDLPGVKRQTSGVKKQE